MSADTCPRCGEPLPADANFCPNCGAPVAVPEASERRVVTVVFVDLAGSTELAARLDAERLREVLAAFHGMVSQEVAWLGGVAEGFIGDAVLGVFGSPVARDDDAIRAVRASLAIRDRTERLGKQLTLPIPMQVRIGVNTGQVAVGTPSDRGLVIGAEVNIGARLQQAAEPGEILVGRTTVELSRTQVDYGEPRRVAAKGFDDALTAWPALGARSGRVPERSRVALVDRRRELTLLTDTFERVADRERAHLVTLLGETGIGKSRVVEEFLARLPDGVNVLAGRSSAFEEQVTFWPLAQMVYREIGEERGAPEDVVFERLREIVRDWVTDPNDVEVATRRLAFALGLGEAGSSENRYHAAEVRSGVLTMLTGLATRGPVVLVFEDLHQADPLLLDLIEQLVKEARRVPLMVVCVARWEFLERSPNWAGGSADAVTLWVEPLSQAQATELAMEAGGLGRDDAERVARHAGGNPFFIIEITGMLQREERDLPPQGPAPSSRLLPATVQAVIAARIDQLTPAARELVRRASVFPRGRFDVDELSLITEPRTEMLDEAEEDEVLVREEDRPGVWRFRSDVFRDVAYESLAKRERQRLHLRVANKLSEPDVADRYPRTIAFHLEQAAKAALDLDPNDRTIAGRAVEALAAAGDIARLRMESRAAADLYERALSLAGPEDGWGEREARIVSMLGEARYWLGEFEFAEESLRKALAHAGDADRVVAHAARFLADITLTIRGDDHLAAALFDRSLAAARRLGEPFALSRVLLMAGWVPYVRGRLDEADALFREALEVARMDGRRDAWAESRALVGLATVVSERGSEEDALAMGLEAVAIGEEAGQAFTAAIAHQTVAASMRRLLRLDEAAAHAETSVHVLRELGARWELAGALGDRGSTHRLAGRLDDAERDLREAFVLCRDLKERALVAWTAAELARTLALEGDTAAARAVLDDPLVRASEAAGVRGSTLSLAAAATSLLEGDEQTALRKSQAAIESQDDGRSPNPYAAAVWWTGTLFGADAAGGDASVRDARERLERNGWRQALREPQLLVAG